MSKVLSVSIVSIFEFLEVNGFRMEYVPDMYLRDDVVAEVIPNTEDVRLLSGDKE